MTAQLPQFSMKPPAQTEVINQSNTLGSTVFVMLETRAAISNADAIAQIQGVDVLLVGANDLSIALGVPADFDSATFRSALETVSAACKAHGKIMGLAGVYDNPRFQRWAVHTLAVGFMLAGQDAAFVAKGARQCVDALRKEVEKP